MPTPLPRIDTAQLQTAANILQLARHRNKNQHGAARWWKWLSMLHRSVHKLLVALLEGNDNGPAEARDEKKRKKKRKKKMDEEGVIMVIVARLRFLKREIVPGCWRAFTNLTHDPQFAPLGLVLLANLARIYRIIGGADHDAPLLMQEEEEGPSRGGPTITETPDAITAAAAAEQGDNDDDNGNLDLGEVIARDADAGPSLTAGTGVEEEEDEDEKELGDARASERRKTADGLPQQQQQDGKVEGRRRQRHGDLKSNRKKKNRNAIDELFRGII